MRRTVLVLVMALGALLTGSPSSLRAQQNVTIDIQNTVATTTCVPNGKHGYIPASVINMAYLDSAIAPEVIEHERVHYQDYLADSTLCRDLMRAKNAKSQKAFDKARDVWMPRVLAMELHAYCATADASIERGRLNPAALYFEDLERMQNQLGFYFEREVIMAAWFDACGRLLNP